MSDEDDTYCRLCAELTPKTQLISPIEDVGLNSKIATKMLWINIDVSTTNTLPNTICFACFDALERTWTFLHNVRIAQTKLSEIFTKNSSDKNSEKEDIGKPINTDWEEFQRLKTEVKAETETFQIATVDPVNLLDIVKAERYSDGENIMHSNRNSTDSDLPLQLAVEKKKLKKRKKVKHSRFENSDTQFPVLTWEDYMCRCASCDALCQNIMSLRLHSLQIHASCCIFKCSDCGKVIANYRSFINHVRLHKKLLRHCCEFCNKRFSMPAYLKSHRNKHHRKAHISMCQNCGSNFENAEQLQDHIILYTKSFKKRSLKREQIEFDLKCDLCDKEFKSRSNLQQHKLVHTERSRDFSCDICGKMFFTKGTLNTHMMTHDDTKPYKCEYCPMAFRARGNLQSHISLHSNAKPFVCEQCGKSFRVKRHLKSHSIVHTDLMPYICEYCNKPFRFKTRLNLHLRQHTGAKPYNCILCQRDFTNGSNYKKHMKRRHNVDTSKRKYNNGNENMEGMDVEIQTGNS